MAHYLVSIEADFAERGGDKGLLIVESIDENKAATDAITRFSGMNHSDFEWSLGRRAYAADHMDMDACYKAVNIQIIQPNDVAILKGYLDNAFPRQST